MRSLIIVTAALALTACQAKDDTKTESAEAPVTAGAPATNAALSAMPTAALSGADAVAAQKLRHDKFEAMGDAMKALSREAKAATPDMPTVQKNAAVLASSSAVLPSWFAPGTGPDAGKTEAKAEIWKTPDDFAAKAKEFHAVAQSLNDAATAGDATAFKAAMGPTGKACKSCHDSYRAED